MTPTPFQQAVLRFRAASNIFNGGGRGSGKSVTLAFDVVDRCRVLQDRARPLCTRETWSGLSQLQEVIVELSRAAFGKCTMNKSEGLLTIHQTNSHVAFTQIADDASYSKHQGKTYCSLYQDEFGNYGPQSVAYSTRLRSNLRTPPGIRPHIHRNANPMGKAHVRCMKDYVLKSPPGVPFLEDATDPESAWWTWFTSDFTLNPHIDQASYERQLIASTTHSAQLQRSWLTGSWEALGGSMFALDPKLHVVDDSVIHNMAYPIPRASGDWGLSAPATALLGFVATHDYGPARAGSLFIVDERDTADPNDLSLGQGHAPQAFAEMVLEMFEFWSAKASTPFVCDDARSMTDGSTVIGLLSDAGLDAYKPYKKDRTGSWALINEMLANAKTRRGPALFINRRCRHLLETMEEAPRDDLRPEDISAKWQRDHWCDAAAYLVKDIYSERGKPQGKTTGYY